MVSLKFSFSNLIAGASRTSQSAMLQVSQVTPTFSDFMVSLVRKLTYKPAYILAKGGITSFDIMKKSLEIEISEVLGQIIPGVPVIKTDSANRFPDIPYIIFPGNVGDEDSLKKVYHLLK